MTRAAVPFRAVLFDLDGVLLDSHDLWLPVVNAVAAEFGCPPVSAERLREIFGQGVEEDARTIYAGCTPEDIRRAYDRVLPKHSDRIALGRETLDVLDDLGRKGIARAVVTNTQPSLAALMLEQTGIAARLETWKAPGEGLREKPASDMLLDALADVGVKASRALMVGDTAYDEEGAVAAGVPFLHFDLREGHHLRAALEQRLTPLEERQS